MEVISSLTAKPRMSTDEIWSVFEYEITYTVANLINQKDAENVLVFFLNPETLNSPTAGCQRSHRSL